LLALLVLAILVADKVDSQGELVQTSAAGPSDMAQMVWAQTAAAEMAGSLTASAHSREEAQTAEEPSALAVPSSEEVAVQPQELGPLRP
jgi:hypothetical protein